MQRQEFYGASVRGPQALREFLINLGTCLVFLLGGLLPMFYILNEEQRPCGNGMNAIEEIVLCIATLLLFIGLRLSVDFVRSGFYVVGRAKPMLNFVVDDKAFTVITGPDNVVGKLTISNISKKIRIKWNRIVSLSEADSEGVQRPTYLKSALFRKAQPTVLWFRGQMKTRAGKTLAECLSGHLGERAPTTTDEVLQA